jgi:heparan-alpha-glucosaminide N-acetyltransferase
MLALWYVVVDMRRWWSGAPFKFVGMNSIIVYAGSEILQA